MLLTMELGSAIAMKVGSITLPVTECGSMAIASLVARAILRSPTPNPLAPLTNVSAVPKSRQELLWRLLLALVGLMMAIVVLPFML